MTTVKQRETTDLKTPRASGLKIPNSIVRAFGVATLFLATIAPQITETAVANGDTRTIYLHHAHTGEDIAATYLVNGQYDSGVLRQLNWFLRDWRREEPTNMDPRLFDVVWEAYRHAGAGNQVINVVSAYRSPETNAMLRARSRAVAKYSQHMLGKAMDTTMPGMPMSNIREIGMRMQRGGVGYYPTAGTPFVHLDVGNVRSWPRMSYDQLVRLFPDGKTVHLPTNGQPLARYEEARAEIEARGNGAYVTAPRRTVGGFFAMLFGGGGEEEPEEVAPPPSTRKQWASLAPRRGRGAQLAGAEDGEEGGAPAPTAGGHRGRQIAQAEANLPRGETVMSAPGAAQSGATAAEGSVETQPVQEAPAAKTKRVRAPLPPSRPTSLVAKLDVRPETADDGGSASLDQNGARVAALDVPAGAGELRSSVEANDSAAETHTFVNAPLPPRRPNSLIALAANVPLPPERPEASRAIATLVDPAETGAERARQDDEALAYTDGAKQETTVTKPKEETPAAPLPPRRTAMSPTRLDPAIARVASPVANRNAVFGATTGLRAAARAQRTAPESDMPDENR